jgi:hypothetical protein
MLSRAVSAAVHTGASLLADRALWATDSRHITSSDILISCTRVQGQGLSGLVRSRLGLVEVQFLQTTGLVASFVVYTAKKIKGAMWYSCFQFRFVFSCSFSTSLEYW